jgi:hypothetical protein
VIPMTPMLSVLSFSHTDTTLVRLHISTRPLLYSEPQYKKCRIYLSIVEGCPT